MMKRHWLTLTEPQQYQRLRKNFEVSVLGKPTPTLDKTIEIDGKFIHSKLTFLSEFSEQLLGGNGYFGADLDSFYDCCTGGIYPINKIEVTWINFSTTLEIFNDKKDLSQILEILTQNLTLKNLTLKIVSKT